MPRFDSVSPAGHFPGLLQNLRLTVHSRQVRPKEKPMSSDAPAPEGAPSHEELKAAFKAFRKRLKLTQLDEESNIGGGPLSGGRRSGIVAISPPQQFSQAVWDELVRLGKIKKAGHG